MSYKKYTKKHNQTIRKSHTPYSMIFFDDMKYNIDDMKSRFGTNIECVHLPHKSTHLLSEVAAMDGDSESISVKSNTYVHNVQQLNATNIYNNTTKSFELAIHKPLLYNWMGNHAGYTKIVLFDWDHALSVTNGVFPPNAFQKKEADIYRRTQRISYRHANIHVYDVAVFLMGGHTRLSGLNRMFVDLHRRGCNVFVLTANSIANTSRQEFIKVIQVIIPYFRKTHLVCSDNGGGGYTSKSGAILKNPTFKRLIGM
jgi:hypothetical protein